MKKKDNGVGIQAQEDFCCVPYLVPLYFFLEELIGCGWLLNDVCGWSLPMPQKQTPTVYTCLALLHPVRGHFTPGSNGRSFLLNIHRNTI